MDALVGLVDPPRARGAHLLRSVLDPPWSLSVEDGAPLTVIIVMHGAAWLRVGRGESRLLSPGDVVLVRGEEPYVLSDTPDCTPRITIQPGNRCEDTEGRDLSEAMALGVRTWGNGGADPSTILISGTYQTSDEVSRTLLTALPQVLVRPSATNDQGIIALLTQEMSTDQLGQELVLDRILDLLLVSVLRGWLAEQGSDAPAWYRAQQDGVVGPALRLLHTHPDHPWTVATLATQLGVSRAALARRFTALVGTPPMAYLTTRRLDRAAELLRGTDLTVAAIARQVGYGSAFALSAAFKREHGVSPQEVRRRPAGAALRGEHQADHPGAAVIDPGRFGRP